MGSVNLTLIGDAIDEEEQGSIQTMECKRVLLYRHLTTGLEMLRNQESLLDTIASDIVEQNQQTKAEISEEMTKRILISFCNIVDSPGPVLGNLSDEDLIKFIIESDETENNADTRSELGATMQMHLAAQINNAATLELKAAQIGDEIGLNNRSVGQTLADWRESDDAPFSVSSVGTEEGVNIWEIKKRR